MEKSLGTGMFHLRKAGNHRPDLSMKRQGREAREGGRRGGAAGTVTPTLRMRKQGSRPPDRPFTECYGE